MNIKKLKLALGLLSGRINFHNLSNCDLKLIGFDPYGCPLSNDDLKDQAEDIIINCLLSIKED